MPELRSDAERNRRAILAAARTVFAQHGLQAPLDEIATRARVGNATLYRRFPDRSQLVAGVFAEEMADYAAAAQAALARPDPWDGFAAFVTHLCARQAEDQGISELLTTSLFDGDDQLAQQRRLVLHRLKRVISRAKAAGAIRADFTHQDVVLLLMANSELVRRTREQAPEAWRRHLAFVLQGIRASAGESAPSAPTVAQIEAAMRSGRG
jgi:AcrR family transcriptional regulator